ncbi:MAG: shikimate dehydrogenase [Casimicrobiaceae bacterium]
MAERYAVVGNPIAHSRSPRIHAEFARATGQDLVYDAILAPLDGFAEMVRAFRRGGGRGLNVTVPFKREAFALANELTVRAREAGAVNTLRFNGDVALGDNTDGAGLVTDLLLRLRVPLGGSRVLLMGAGGAARGVVGPLLRERPAALAIANRTVAKARELAQAFAAQGPVRGGGYEDVAGSAFDIVINATSASLEGVVPPLPPGVFAPGALAYDMVYGEHATSFLERARATGAATTMDGLGMLVAQAAESFLLWRGVRPETAAVIDLLRAR